MKFRNCSNLLIISIISSLLLLPTVFAQEIATIVEIEGNVWLIPTGSNERQEAATGAAVGPGDMIVTGSDGSAALVLADESIIRLHHGSEFRLNDAAPVAGWLTGTTEKLKSTYKLLKGELWFRNKRRESDIEISTAHVSISVRGTEFSVRAEDNVAYVSMLEGEIQARNRFGSINASSGEQVIAERGKPPRKVILLNPDDAVQWTLRVPALLEPGEIVERFSKENPSDNLEFESRLRRALTLINEGKYAQANSLLASETQEKTPKKDNANYEYFRKLLSAWVSIETGNLNKAQSSLSALVKSDVSEPIGWQLYSLVALVNNDSGTALQAAQVSLAIDSSDATSHLLESYAQQAKFELAKAESSARKSTETDNQYAPGWLQRAKLALNAGYHQRALEYAQRALEISRNDSGALATLGYIYLAMERDTEARQTFNEAIENGQANADAHLGAALIAMRSGDSDSALKSIAGAVSIEPLAANYLNYMARILYDEKRFDRAEELLLRAHELDPEDPTPLFLRSIIAKDQKKFAEAIELIEEAVELNDNFAVYKPRYLLDNDLAVKNVDLSLAYQAFGFNSWAQRKAAEAIKQDPQNFAAHLLYAGSTNEQPGRDTVFASEQLLARILQPANTNTFNDFNQYTPLFNQPDIGGSLLFGRGSFNQIDREMMLFGGLPSANFAFQTNVFSSRSDGWRETENESIDSLAIAMKWDAHPDHSFYLGVRKQKIEDSDELLRRFEFDAPSEPRDNRKKDEGSYELAYNAALSPTSSWLNYLSYFDRELDELNAEVNITQPLISFISISDLTSLIDQEQQSYLGQSQLTFEEGNHTLFAGIFGNYREFERVDQNSALITVTNLAGDVLLTIPDTNTPKLDVDNRSQSTDASVYFIDHWQVNEDLLIEAGLYWNYFENTEITTDREWSDTRLNPRLGITWNIDGSQTLRLAAYRYVFSLVPARIDPVTIAGLSLYRGAQPGSLVDEANLAYEYEWTSGLVQILAFYNEAEFESRFRLASITNDLSVEKIVVDSRRHGIETALNYLPHRYIGTNLSLSHFNTTDEGFTFADREETLASLGITLSHPTGITFGLEQLYRKMRYDNRSGDDEFGSLNASLDYILPGREAKLAIEVNNIEDNHFNWVTDSFVVSGEIPRRQWVVSVEIFL